MIKNKLSMLTGAALLTLSVSAEAVVVDLFSTAQGPYRDELNGLGTTGGSFGGLGGGALTSSGGAVALDGSILGTERDLWVDVISGADDASDTGASVRVGTTVNTGGDGLTYDALQLSMDGGVVARAGVQWDGAGDAGSTTLDTTGLGGIDLTSGGVLTDLEVITLSSDGGGVGSWTFDITAYTFSDPTQWSTISLVATTIPSGTGPVSSLIDLGGFLACGFSNGIVTVTCGGAGADVTDLGALEVVFNTSNSHDVDLRLVSVQTAVPEPSVLGLLGAGLLAGGLVSVRRRKKA